MNIKLHTPKSLQLGSGISTLKQILLSIIATSISIALTFGTAAILDYNKKEREKREMVLMIMYDMYTSIKSVEKADSLINKSIDLQLKIAKDTSLYHENPFALMHLMPSFTYSETVEKIFSSNIETINTLGNVLFAENVSYFYMLRKDYHTLCDTVTVNAQNNDYFSTLEKALMMSYEAEAISSYGLLVDMKQVFEECQDLMDISDDAIKEYCTKRELMDNNSTDDNLMDSSIKVNVKKIKELEEAKKKLRL